MSFFRWFFFRIIYFTNDAISLYKLSSSCWFFVVFLQSIDHVLLSANISHSIGGWYGLKHAIFSQTSIDILLHRLIDSSAIYLNHFDECTILIFHFWITRLLQQIKCNQISNFPIYYYGSDRQQRKLSTIQ